MTFGFCQLLQENIALAREFSSQRSISNAGAAAAAAAAVDAEAAEVEKAAEDNRTRVSRFMPTSRRIVQVGTEHSKQQISDDLSLV